MIRHSLSYDHQENVSYIFFFVICCFPSFSEFCFWHIPRSVRFVVTWLIQTVRGFQTAEE
jgi:hypothetical protein